MLSPRPRAAAASCACLALTATAAHAAHTHGDVASFYSTGRITASGEKFDKHALKAAHRTLPFGSIVKVVNRHNGRSVVVEINDRGPAKWTRRTIDLTQEAAKRVGMVRRGVVPVNLEVAHVTRRQLDRAFGKLLTLADRKAALEAQASHSAMSAYASAAEPEPAQFQLASAIATEITRPIATMTNIFKAYVESLVRPSGPHVNLICPDGKPLPEKLRVVLRRAAWEFDGVVEVISGYRSLAYNRGIYGHRCRGGKCRGDRSQHILCKAADFRIAGVSPARLYSWALKQPELGGIGRYRNDFIHVDVRSRPSGRLITWDWRARKFARKQNHKPRYAKAVHTQPEVN